MQLRRPGRLPVVPGARARAPGPPGRRLRRPALSRPDALRRRGAPLPNHAVLGQVVPLRTTSVMLGETTRRRSSRPLNFYELGASRLGFLPEPFAFSLRAFRAVAPTAARRGSATTWCTTCSAWAGACWACAPSACRWSRPCTTRSRWTGAPPSCATRDSGEALGTMKFYPVGMQAFVARRTRSRAHVLRGERAPDRDDFGVARSGCATSPTVSTRSSSVRIPTSRAARRAAVRGARGRSQQGDRRRWCRRSPACPPTCR